MKYMNLNQMLKHMYLQCTNCMKLNLLLEKNIYLQDTNCMKGNHLTVGIDLMDMKDMKTEFSWFLCMWLQLTDRTYLEKKKWSSS